jgi:Domain of unknown function (DUF1851)
MAMFDRFMSRFRLVPFGQEAGVVWLDPGLLLATGYLELASQFAGCSFENGLYRLHDDRTGPLGLALIEQAFPDFARRARPFGYDWLGRQFALDAGRIEDGEPLVLMMEPGTGETLEVPLPFEGFHEHLDELREPALAAGFFAQWVSANPAQLPLRSGECVGYRVPLFLGGQDTVANLEVIDFEVYWSLCGQLRQGTRHLPTGTTVQQVSLGD